MRRRILLQFIHYPISSGLYMQRALLRMGHDARTTGFSTGNGIWGGFVHDSHFPSRIETGWQPELIIVADSHPAILESEWTDCYGAPTVIYGVDNHVRNYATTRGIDHRFFAHNIVSLDCGDFTWLPCGYDPDWHTPSGIEWDQREFDVLLAGQKYPMRELAIRLLSQAGIRVHYTIALRELYASLYHNARVSLNWSASGDIPQRLFEAVAMDNVFYTDPLPDLAILRQDPDFPQGAVIEASNGMANIVGDVKAALAFPSLADSAWIDRQRWDDRMQVILDWLDEWESS